MFLCKTLILVTLCRPCWNYGDIDVRVAPQVAQPWNMSICFTLCQLYAVEIITCTGKRDTSVVMNVCE